MQDANTETNGTETNGTGTNGTGSTIPVMTVIRRGLSRRCPRCGEGAVLTG